MIRSTNKGLYFEPGDFYLDPVKPVENAIISHAHADHAITGNGKVWCTHETMGLMRIRYGEKLKSVFNTYQYKSSFSIRDTVITLYPAGHMLGSAQVLIDHNGKRYCYTGDFKPGSDSSCEAFETVSCDVLITETTFADPEVIHPAEAEELRKLEAYENCNLVIGAYNLGKAQRLTQLIHQHFPGRRIMVHHEASRFHRYYENRGIQLGKWEPYNYRLFNRTKGNILIAPPRVLSTFLRHNGIVTAFATGWKKSPVATHFNFHISDHADWNDINTLIKKCGAKQILTVHGCGSTLQKHYENSGLNVAGA